MPGSPAAFLTFTALCAALIGAQPPPKNGSTVPPESKSPPGLVTLERGEISGAKFTLARPANWNRRVLLHAHGYRAEDKPLVADLFPEQAAYKTYLDEGWIIAATSYRRNGIIVADAMADLDALRAHIEEKYGAPERVLLEGESMGGLIVTLLAERERPDRPRYAGAVAIGAALEIKEASATPALTHQPHIPLLFLTNRSELDGPRNYVQAKVSRGEKSVPPSLFQVSRDGHVNVNQRERLAALRALNAWLDHGTSALPQPTAGTTFFDATAAPEPRSSQIVPRADGRGFEARVTEVSANYGNVLVNAQPADFAAAGIKQGMRFQLTAHGLSFDIVYGSDFNSVPRGEWVAFVTSDGWFMISRNWADAAATAHLAVGDTITLRRSDDAK